MEEKTEHKNISTQPQQQNKHAHSIAGSMLRDVARELGLESLFNGKIVHVSFDCPENLRKAFKQEIISNQSSQCKELQKFMLSYIVVSRIKKHALGNTLSRVVDVPFTIENLSLNQYVQSRPRRRVRKFSGVDSGDDEGSVRCVFCGGEADGFYRYKSTGEVVPLCLKCFERLKLNYEFVRWVDSDE